MEEATAVMERREPRSPPDVAERVGPRREPGEFSLLGVVNALLRNRKVLVALPAVCVGLVLVLFVLGGSDRYTARATFTPEQGNEQGSSAAQRLIGGLGLNLGVSQYESVEFYATLLRSRRILEAGALTPYTIDLPDDGTFEGTLLDLYAPEAGTPREQLAATVPILRDGVTVNTAPASGLIMLEVSTSWPQLSVAVAERLISLVNEFNVERQQQRMLEQQRFFEARMSEARAELNAAERELGTFMERNRRYQESPELMLEANRLQRAVDFRQGLYTSLAESYEQARIAAVRNTPLVSVVDPPAVERPGVGGGLVARLVFAALLGLMLAGAVIVVREFLRVQRERNGPEYREFRRLLGSIRHDFRIGRRRAAPGG